MRLAKIERFSLQTVAAASDRFGNLLEARVQLARFIGSVLEVSGKVQKVVKCDGQCKLVIEPGDVPDFLVFADLLSDAENLIKHKIRKGSAVSVRGRFLSFGRSAVCLFDCRLIAEN